MRVALINQAFYPDVVSSGQHLTDLAVQLVERGHEVTVVTSRRGYNDPAKKFAKAETWRGIHIYRIFNTGFGKRSKWTRAADSASFIVCCFLRLCLLSRQDLVVGLTSPPMLAVLASCFALLRGGKFVYWVMDLNPDQALAAGWLSPGSLVARWLESLSRFSLQRAERIIALDRFMQKHIASKGIPIDKIDVIPPWSHDSEVNFDPDGRMEFRRAHGFEDRFVIMYCGNHSPCHPLDTLLGAARDLACDPEIVFCFVGGGTEFARVKEFAAREHLANIICLPYQPLARLSACLSAADLHTVVMGDSFVGLVHPCKVYNILRVGIPLLYIGPEPNHITDMLGKIDVGPTFRTARHGDPKGIGRIVLEIKKSAKSRKPERDDVLPDLFTRRVLVPRLVSVLESVASNAGKGFVAPLNRPVATGQ